MPRFLVIQLARLGDLVQTGRLLQSLTACPDAEVHLCVDGSLAPLAGLLYPKVVVHELPAHAGTDAAQAADVFTKARDTFGLLRSLDFTHVYTLNFSPLSFACAALFEPERVRGYALVRGQERRDPLFDLALNIMRDRRFAALNLTDLWAHLHPGPLPPEKVNPIPKPAGSGRVGIVLSGRESRRSLDASTLALCAQAVFQARGGPALVLLGSRAEAATARRFVRHLPPAAAKAVDDLTGRTCLTDLPDVVRGLDLLLTPDTGLMHLAAHLGVPVQAFFLSSAWCHETGPYGFGHTVWQALEPCSPCLESAPCPHNERCRSPFAHEAFLAHLSGKHHQDWPDNLLGFASMLDDLGVRYRCVDGDDLYAAGRNELRSALGLHLGLSARGQADLVRPLPYVSPELAEFLYTEKNWMLPPSWRSEKAAGRQPGAKPA